MPTRVTLAKTWYEEADVMGWWAQPKLDGCRATFDGERLLSRTGKPFNAPEWWIKTLVRAKGELGTLDGELIHRTQLPHLSSELRQKLTEEIGASGFNTVVSTVRKKSPVDDEWDNILYCVFDVIGEGTYEQRYEDLWCNFKDGNYSDMADVHAVIEPDSNIEDILLDAQERGWEGVMLRNPKMYYEHRRSPNLLKVKPHEDIEAEVIEEVEGTGKYKGMMGALVCRSGDLEFRVGTGFTDADRALSWKGELITVEFFERTPSGVPRHPRFKGTRDYE